MAATTQFAVVTPAGVKLEGRAEIVIAPGRAGDLAALVNHASLLTTLRTGVLRATMAAANVAVELARADQGRPLHSHVHVAVELARPIRRIELAVNGGFMQILPDKVVVLTDVAMAADEVGADRVRAELKQAEEALAQKRGADDQPEREAVAWATARLEVAQRSP